MGGFKRRYYANYRLGLSGQFLLGPIRTSLFYFYFLFIIIIFREGVGGIKKFFKIRENPSKF